MFFFLFELVFRQFQHSAHPVTSTIAGTQSKTGSRTVVTDLHIYGSTDLDNIRFSRINLLMETNVNFGDIIYDQAKLIYLEYLLQQKLSKQASKQTSEANVNARCNSVTNFKSYRCEHSASYKSSLRCIKHRNKPRILPLHFKLIIEI